MGGGEFVRAATKMAGMGVTSAGLRGASAVPQFEQLLRGTPRPASVAVASSSSLQHAKASVGTGVECAQKPTWELDDWEFAAFDDELAAEAAGPKPRIVFGAVPSFEEAKEATSDLKEALDKVYLSSPESSVLSCGLETKSCLIGSRPNSPVPNQAIQAFRFLKESPQVQTVVASIASDQNVWNAMLENQELKSFLHSYQTNKELELLKLPEELEEEPDASNGKASGNIFSDMFQHVKASVVDMVANASSLFQKVFGFSAAGDNQKGTSGSTIPEISVSIMGLVVLVVMVLVTKRI